jgi:thiamine biosynthesis protein ThiS
MMNGFMGKMKLQINGEMREIKPVSNVRELLQALGIAAEHIAIEVNGEIVRQADWERTPIVDQDKIEIVMFVGGG